MNKKNTQRSGYRPQGVENEYAKQFDIRRSGIR